MIHRLSWSSASQTRRALHLHGHVHDFLLSYTTIEPAAMRTNIEIDDDLLSQAMTLAGLSTKRATVEEGLRLLVRVRRQAGAIADLRGLGWEGDLDEMREGRPPQQV